MITLFELFLNWGHSKAGTSFTDTVLPFCAAGQKPVPRDSVEEVHASSKSIKHAHFQVDEALLRHACVACVSELQLCRSHFAYPGLVGINQCPCCCCRRRHLRTH